MVKAETHDKEINEIIQQWRQGDCVLGEHWFVYRFDPSLPLTPEGKESAENKSDLVEAEVLGLMVASQSCDIVRECTERPFIEVCPLVEVDEQYLKDVERGRRPRFLYIPGVAEKNLVADLDRVMTVEKAVLANWDRIPGCHNDDERRQLRQSLIRKRGRVAFPDDFNELVKDLCNRLTEKHDKQSDEGRALRSLREIRIQAGPSWNDDKVTLKFLFIRNENEPNFEGQNWNTIVDKWLKLIPSKGRFEVDGLIQTLEDMTAKEYIESDPLDLDYLSDRKK